MKYKMFTCSNCKKKFFINFKAYWNMKLVCQKCFNELKRKRKSKMLKDKNIGDYVYIYLNDHPFCNSKGYILEHRLVVEQKIKRYLTKKEVIHHINEKKDDNRIGNLMLFKNQGEHMSFHKKIIKFGYTNPVKKMIRERFD